MKEQSDLTDYKNLFDFCNKFSENIKTIMTVLNDLSFSGTYNNIKKLFKK